MTSIHINYKNNYMSLVGPIFKISVRYLTPIVIIQQKSFGVTFHVLKKKNTFMTSAKGMSISSPKQDLKYLAP